MATRYSIFPSVADDRVYNAVDFLARPSRDFLAGEGDGVSREVGNAMAVTETSPASLAVSVDTGSCRANGYRFEVFTAAEEVALSTADATNPRIDRIVVQARTDSANRDMRLTVIEGTPAVSPSAPALTRTSDTYEISLAQVLVGAGVTSVSNSEITDERGDTSVCGWLQVQDAKLLNGSADTAFEKIAPVSASDTGTDVYEFDIGFDIATGDVFTLDIGSANTTATPTLENTGGAPSGAQSIVKPDGTAAIGMIEARPHRLQWDGTNYVLLDAVSSGIPSGVITLWSGAISNIPSGWALCDGTSGTPNLTDRFVLHADADSAGTHNVGDTGGSFTTDGHTLTISEIPAHNHTMTTVLAGSGSTPRHPTERSSQASVSSEDTDNAGGGGAHTHGMTPKYYALAYIMKL